MNLYTSEIYSASTGVFSAGSNLKDDIGRFDGCVAQIDSNSFIITGGNTDAGFDKTTVRHDMILGCGLIFRNLMWVGQVPPVAISMVRI